MFYERFDVNHELNTDMLIGQYVTIARLINNIKGIIVFDRFHPSEYVYSRIFKRKQYDDIVFDVDSLIKNNAIIFYCELDRELIYKHLNEEKYNFNKSSIEKILKYYDEFLSKTKIEFIRVNTKNFDEAVLTCKAVINWSVEKIANY